jgi:dephospho-CoA kinase
LINAAFPGLVSDGVVDRARLGALVFADRAALRRLEAILHPLVQHEREKFLRRARKQRCKMVVLDVPLLLETGGERNVDYVVVVSCPAFLQSARALARPGMTKAKLASIRASQLPDWQKRKKADRVIPTGAGKRLVLRQIALIRRDLSERTD